MDDLLRLLEEAGASYEVLDHERTDTAGAEARVLGLPPAEVAKTLIVATPSGRVRAVLPASQRLDMHKLRSLLDAPAKKLHLASEEELEREYPQFELGAVPPFGGPSDPVVVDRRVADQASVVVEAGSHDKSIRLAAADLVELTDARIADICAD